MPRGASLGRHNLIACTIQTVGALALHPQCSHFNILPRFHIAGWMAALAVIHARGRWSFIRAVCVLKPGARTSAR